MYMANWNFEKVVLIKIIENKNELIDWKDEFSFLISIYYLSSIINNMYHFIIYH